MQTVMLLYHRVVPRDLLDQVCSVPQIVTPLDDFEAQLDFLADQYHILSMSEFEKTWKERRVMPLRTAVITFDDGWEDNYLYAFPALKQKGAPATIFLSTANIGTSQAFWQEQVWHLLKVWHHRVRAGEIDADEARQLPPSLKAALLSPNPEHEALLLIENLKVSDDHTRSALLEDLAGKLQSPSFPSHANGFMNWEQVRKMHAAGIEFGSHADTHRLLTSLSLHDVAGEVRKSKQLMENMLGASVTTFAYPNGNYNSGVIKQLQSAGYRLAATTKRGLNTAWTNPFELRRININGGICAGSDGHFSSNLFALKLTGGIVA